MFIKECIISKYGTSCISPNIFNKFLKKDQIFAIFLYKLGETLIHNFFENYKFVKNTNTNNSIDLDNLLL